MGIFDKAKDALGEHPEQVDQGVAKAGDLADEKTGHQHSERIDQGEQLAKDHLAGPGSPADPVPDAPTAQ